MPKRTFTPLALSLVLTLSVLTLHHPALTRAEVSGSSLSQEQLVIHQQQINLEAGHKATVQLTGQLAAPSNIYYQKLELRIVRSGYPPEMIKLPLQFNEGYTPSFSAADFTGDQKDEIVVSLPTGGSSLITNYLIYSREPGKWTLIYSPIYPAEIKLTGKYLDNYKVRLELAGIRQPIELDLSDRKQSYEDAGIYRQGKLSAPVMPWLNADTMEIVDMNEDGIKEVRVHYTINGTCNADDIASVWATWKYKNNRWNRINITFQPIRL